METENEIVPQAVGQEEPQEQPELQQQAAVPNPEAEAANDKNIRMLREKARRADQYERERDELARILKAQQDAKPQVPEEDYEVRLGDDEIAEGKHIAKMGRKIKALEQKLQGYQQQTSENVVEAKIKAQYPDFDKVVSLENVKALSSSYPELAATLNASSDLYGKAVSAYTMIKKLGIAPAEDIYSVEREMAAKNAAKPRPLASVSPQQGDSPLSHANAFANGLTPELRKSLQKEMAEAMKKI